MVYRSKPWNPSADISDVSGPIRINFENYKTAWEINHVDINDANAGKHTKVDIPIAPLTYTLLDDEMLINTKESGEIPDLSILTLYRLIGGGSQENIDMTNGLVHELEEDPATLILETYDGWFRDPSGVLVKWGTSAAITVSSTTDYTIKFPVKDTVPVFATAPMVLPLLRVNNTSVAANLSLKSSSTSQFVVNSDYLFSDVFSVAYVAIGT